VAIGMVDRTVRYAPSASLRIDPQQWRKNFVTGIRRTGIRWSEEFCLARFRIIAVATVMLGALIGHAFPAVAEGTTRIQQADGTTQIYHHVMMRMSGATLSLRSSDRQGMLEVTSGACTYLGGLQRCLPYKTIYHDHGTAHTIALEHGTVYTNMTGDAVRLPHSGDRLGPHEVMVLLHTIRGTYVSVKGTLDQLK